MIEKIKNQIDISRNENQTIIDYIKAFNNSEKAKELFSENDDYKNYLQEEKREEKKEEDEFF